MNPEDKKIKYARIDVARSMIYKRVYKYLTYESGLKMLSHNNLQFTRAKDLDDKVDCHISKVNFDYVWEFADLINSEELIKRIHTKHEKSISSFGICSLGTSPDNSDLWDTYTKTDNLFNGICIELEHHAVINCFVKKHNQKVASLKVDYVDEPIESIPYEWFISKDASEQYKFMGLLFATKDKSKWEKQQEVRIILPKELSTTFQRYELSKQCFKAVYLGKDVTEEQREEIEANIKKAKLDIKIYTCETKEMRTHKENEK